MDSSPLINLPPELRDRIYEFSLLHNGPISLSVSTGQPISRRLDLTITTLCRQLREETIPIFFNINAFTAITKYLEADSGDPRSPRLRKPFSGLKDWLSTIGSANANRLTRLTIDLGWFTVEDGRHQRITEMMDVAKEEIHALPVSSSILFLRAAYVIEVFPPIVVTTRYIDVPLGNKAAAAQNLEATTTKALASMPSYAANRDDAEVTMNLFMDGLKGMVIDSD